MNKLEMNMDLVDLVNINELQINGENFIRKPAKRSPTERTTIAVRLTSEYIGIIQKQGPLPVDLIDKAATYFAHGVDWGIQETEKEHGIG